MSYARILPGELRARIDKLSDQERSELIAELLALAFCSGYTESAEYAFTSEPVSGRHGVCDTFNIEAMRRLLAGKFGVQTHFRTTGEHPDYSADIQHVKINSTEFHVIQVAMSPEIRCELSMVDFHPARSWFRQLRVLDMDGVVHVDVVLLYRWQGRDYESNGDKPCLSEYFIKLPGAYFKSTYLELRQQVLNQCAKIYGAHTSDQ